MKKKIISAILAFSMIFSILPSTISYAYSSYGVEADGSISKNACISELTVHYTNGVIDKISEKMDDMPDTMLEQAATSFIKETYSVLGVNTDKLQNRYILTTGGKMLALAFLGMLASVTVGLLASRVAASTGRDLRGKVFKKVVGFSNAEFDKFSTASLITRSTNDIQQIQMLAVMLLRMVMYAPIMAIGGIF